MDVEDLEYLAILSQQLETDINNLVSLFQMQEAMKTCSLNDEMINMVYFKGLVSDEIVTNVKMSFAGIGVAICDPNGCCVFELPKSFLLEAGYRRSEGDVVELNALIEALNAADDLGLKRVRVIFDSDSVYQYLTGKLQPRNKKIVTLVDQLNIIKRKFSCFDLLLVSQNHVKFAYKLARDAIRSEATNWADSASGKTLLEQCTICYEYIHNGQMFCVNECLHRYCFSCMRKHVEAKLLQGKLPECPHEKCESELEIESCKKFLTSELYDIMSLQIKEASIPPEQKVYCPFSTCSYLMSKTEVQQYTATSSTADQGTGMIKCVKCNRLFCINCKVPWHDNITCSDYMQSFLFQSSNEGKLRSLATQNCWRQCVKCSNLVELAAGCYHIYCRCGYEFCYTCGSQYIDKIPTCRCPLWDEHYIIYAEQNMH